MTARPVQGAAADDETSRPRNRTLPTISLVDCPSPSYLCAPSKQRPRRNRQQTQRVWFGNGILDDISLRVVDHIVAVQVIPLALHTQVVIVHLQAILTD